ncbi:MAG: co-chaperone GroES [Psittacicella sp.]
MSIRPLQNRVIIKREDLKSNSTIILSSKEKSTRGVVVAVGSGSYINGIKIPVDLKVGDVVIFNDNHDIVSEKIDGDELLILSENDILAVVE